MIGKPKQNVINLMLDIMNNTKDKDNTVEMLGKIFLFF